ncbi:hypothetical protein WG66_008977 [Moniliophthora roreri]|nr:hypothetical protein WG66_008977 [Moniliophthora roreri]
MHSRNPGSFTRPYIYRRHVKSISGEEDGGEAAKVDANRDAHVQHVDPAEVLSLLDKLTGQLSGSGGYPELSGPSNVNTRYLDCKTRTTTPQNVGYLSREYYVRLWHRYGR